MTVKEEVKQKLKEAEKELSKAHMRYMKAKWEYSRWLEKLEYCETIEAWEDQKCKQ